MTAGCWSPTRPAVLIVACADGNLQAWDFTDSCSRPSTELHATHARITSIEFLASSGGANPARVQLLALGDETGTLHVFEVPRSLTRPVPKEEQIMQSFFEREQARGEYIKTMPEIEGFAASSSASASAVAAALSGASAESKKADRTGTAAAASNNKSAPGTAAAGGASGQPADGAVPDEADEAAKALKKEEDEFLKIEAAFIAELGLDWQALPETILVAHPGPPKESDAKK